jgi:hypothetical protein
MAGHFGESAAFQAASDLVFKGLAQPSGYTEPLLHAWRLKVKAAAEPGRPATAGMTAGRGSGGALGRGGAGDAAPGLRLDLQPVERDALAAVGAAPVVAAVEALQRGHHRGQRRARGRSAPSRSRARRALRRVVTVLQQGVARVLGARAAVQVGLDRCCRRWRRSVRSRQQGALAAGEVGADRVLQN